MSKFYHHPDGIITVDNGVSSLSISLQEFLTYEPAYTLPAPYVARLYTPGVGHFLYTKTGQFAGQFPYTAGDGYIANVNTYINEHNNPVLTLTEAKNIRKAAVDALSDTKKQGHVLLFSNEFLSTINVIPANRLLSYQNLGAVPMGFYVNNSAGSPITLTLAQLKTLNDGIVQLHYLCDVNANSLKASIDALGTVNAVNSFDITTGWPTIPYTPV